MNFERSIYAATLQPEAAQDDDLCEVSFDIAGAMTKKPYIDIEDLVIDWQSDTQRHATDLCKHPKYSSEYSTDLCKRPKYSSEYSSDRYHLEDSKFSSDKYLSEDIRYSTAGSLAVADGHQSTLQTRFTTIKKQGKLRRWRISAPTFTIGTTFLALGQWMVLQYGFPNALSLVGHVLYVLGFPITLLAVLPLDRILIRIAGAVFVILLLVDFTGARIRGLSDAISGSTSGDCMSYGDRVPTDICKYEAPMHAILIVTDAALLAYTIFGCSRSSTKNLRAIWIGGSLWCIVNGLLSSVVHEIVSHIVGFVRLPGGVLACGVFSIVTGSIFIQKRFRIRVQAWLASRGEATVAAAGISELIDGQSVMAVITKARTSFYSVAADKILEEDFATSTPNSALHALTERAHLGGVDVFLSHSWHDDAKQKWDALQAWRTRFKMANNREPRLWIDKYCLDQNNIKDSLSCLPVYLSGCQQILVLRGQTYLHRLWCIIELYIFLQMHGSVEDLEVYTLGSTDDLESMKSEVESFNVFEAECTSQADTERLVVAIEAGSGGAAELEELVKVAFLK